MKVESLPVTDKPRTLDYERDQYANAFFDTNMVLDLIDEGASNISFKDLKYCMLLIYHCAS